MGNNWTPKEYSSVVPTLRADHADQLLLKVAFDTEVLHRDTDHNGKITHTEVRIEHGGTDHGYYD